MPGFPHRTTYKRRTFGQKRPHQGIINNLLVQRFGRPLPHLRHGRGQALNLLIRKQMDDIALLQCSVKPAFQNKPQGKIKQRFGKLLWIIPLNHTDERIGLRAQHGIRRQQRGEGFILAQSM